MADGKPVGEGVDWRGAKVPEKVELGGRTVVLRPVDPAGDVGSLFRESHPPDGDPSIWTYLAEGPYGDVEEMRAKIVADAASADPLWFSIVPREEGVAAGRATYLRIEPAMGTIEIGNIWFGPRLRRTTAATEAIYLLARHAFEDLGYRRLEWKCDSLNAASRRAAARFGFRFEGIFRNHMVIKGRNRDTAWFSIIDAEWPAIGAGFAAFLDPANFDAEGAQRRPLAEFLPTADGG
ncbi:MAG: GNAT family N-acetyltransferase [Actinobacteria bacterium]|nr:GNAT family N-acetyltransferase [Actinomycetota bacterium]